MASKVTYPQPAGFYDVLALLRIVAEPELHLERLQSLEAVRAELEERAQCEESYERQVALEADARGKLAEATRVLDAARIEAGKLRAEAEADAVSVRASLRGSRDEWAAARAKEQDALKAQQKALEERERIAAQNLETAKTKLARAEFLMSEASKLQAEYHEKVAKLKGIVS